MSEENKTSLDELRKLHAQYVFIHQCLTQKGQYFIDEFDIAKDAVKTITSVANQLGEKIQELSPENEESSEDNSPVTFEVPSEQA